MSGSYAFIFSGPAPKRLDKVLIEAPADAQLLQGVTRSQLQSWIERGAVSVAGKRVEKAGFLVKPGAEVTITAPPPLASDWLPYELKLEILHEDDDLIVLDKPAGLPMHPGAGNRERTLVNALVHHCGKEIEGLLTSERPGIVHRLDKDTTGIVVVAKSPRILMELATQFKDRTVKRQYRTLVFYGPRSTIPIAVQDKGRIETLLARDPGNRLRMHVSDAGKRAITNWAVAERFHYGALLDVTLGTGRTHQIRAHMESVGAPVVGDPMYGNFSAMPKELLLLAQRFGRQALHARRLEFFHPTLNRRLNFERECPADMLELIAAFRGIE